MIFKLANNSIDFPPPDLAEEDGLLAIGGDLSAERLLHAYSQGIFPWYSDASPILWYSPHQRFVIYPSQLKISKSLRQIIRSGKFRVTQNKAFTQVIEACKTIARPEQEGTWITEEMQQAYIRLHELGHAHSVEVWEKDYLAGGLYGIVVNRVFCGESMFSRVNNASKTALAALCDSKAYTLIDCQVYSRHLEDMGAVFISRKAYMELISRFNSDE